MKQTRDKKPKIVKPYVGETTDLDRARPFGIYSLAVVRGSGSEREEDDIRDTNYDEQHNDALEILAACNVRGIFQDIRCTSGKKYSGGRVTEVSLEGSMSKSTDCGPSEMPFSGTISRPYYDQLSFEEYNRLGRPQTVMRTVSGSRAIYLGYTMAEIEAKLKR